jgi:hypothetical protein
MEVEMLEPGYEHLKEVVMLSQVVGISM